MNVSPSVRGVPRINGWTEKRQFFACRQSKFAGQISFQSSKFLTFIFKVKRFELSTPGRCYVIISQAGKHCCRRRNRKSRVGFRPAFDLRTPFDGEYLANGHRSGKHCYFQEIASRMPPFYGIFTFNIGQF